MADKELLDRVTVAVEDAEATPDRELDWTRHQVPAKSPTAQLGRLCPPRRQGPRPAVRPGHSDPLLTVVYRS
jgi:hypothetical protein